MPRLKLLTAATLTTLLAALLAACGGTPQTAAPTASQSTNATSTETNTAPAGATAATGANTPATLRIGTGGSPDSLNPGAGYLSEAFDIWGLTYDSLLEVDLKGQFHPSLAESYSPSEDGKTWTFKLHEGVQWHDGKPLTAEDVAFTYNMIMGFESFGLLKDYTAHFETVEAIDPTTVKITLDAPIGNMELNVWGLYVLPKHIWEQFKDEQSALEFENTNLIGSGPFILEEYRQGEFTRLKANKNHFTSPPKVDEIIFQTYANPDALVQALRSGEVDMITELPNTTITSLKNEPNIQVAIGESRSLSDIIFNVIDPANCPKDDGKCTGHPALRDVKVRQALAHATDKQQLIDVALLGLGSPGLGLVPLSLGDWYNSSLQDYAYEPEKAKQILEDAGYKDTDGDGVREMPGDPSNPLRFRFTVPSDILTGAREAEIISGMWKEVGVQIDVQVLEPDTVTAMCCPAFDYDVLLWGWGADPDPQPLLNILTTGQIPTGVSETGYSNPEYDRIFEQQAITVDRAERKELIWKLQEIALRDVPYIIPYYRQSVQAYRSDRFQGWVIEEGGILDFTSRISLTAVEPVQ